MRSLLDDSERFMTAVRHYFLRFKVKTIPSNQYHVTIGQAVRLVSEICRQVGVLSPSRYDVRAQVLAADGVGNSVLTRDEFAGFFRAMLRRRVLDLEAEEHEELDGTTSQHATLEAWIRSLLAYRDGGCGFVLLRAEIFHSLSRTPVRLRLWGDDAVCHMLMQFGSAGDEAFFLLDGSFEVGTNAIAFTWKKCVSCRRSVQPRRGFEHVVKRRERKFLAAARLKCFDPEVIRKEMIRYGFERRHKPTSSKEPREVTMPGVATPWCHCPLSEDTFFPSSAARGFAPPRSLALSALREPSGSDAADLREDVASAVQLFGFSHLWAGGF